MEKNITFKDGVSQNVEILKTVDDVYHVLEFDPMTDDHFSDLETLADVVEEFNNADPDIINGMKYLEYDDDECSWIFGIGRVKDINKSDLDKYDYKFHYLMTEDERIFVFYSLSE